jgi:pyruvate/2-oxoglutarate dehydrogenase complex dihydrolipoamide dehydrogenase (E3) component
MTDFDLAVIGAGAAGLSVTAVAAQLGLRVALIERARMGGDCLNTGCVPSKALLAAAHAVQSARAANQLGVRLPEPRIDWAAVHAHVHGAIAAIAPMDSVARYTALGATVLQGEARFTGPDALEVALPAGPRRLTAKRIVIAAGGRAAIPDLPGLADTPYLTHEQIFDLPAPPAHLLILGGGPIGLEMAQAHAALGCRVTLVQRRTIAPNDDPELADGLRRALAAEGIALLENTAVAAVEPGPTLVLADGARLSGSHLLIATGRTPNLAALALDAAGIRATAHGIATDAGLRSLTNRRVFAVGDIADPEGIGPRHFTHVGSYHAGIVIRCALFRLPARVDYAALPRVTYTSPELAQTGLTEAEARAAGHRDLRILRWPLAENDRAVAERRTEGLVKLVALPNGRLLGAGILAPHAGEMIGTFTLAIAQRLKLSALAGMIVPYPTLAEVGKRAAGTFFTPKLFSTTTKWLVRQLARLP